MDARGTGGLLGGRLLVGMAIVVLVGGCATGSGPGTVPPSSSPSSSPSAAVVTPTATSGTASPSPTAAPASYGPVTVVTGTATCPGMSWDWTTEPDGTQHVRDGHSPKGCTVTTDDPRVSGHRTSTWNMDLWGDANAGTGALVGWGTPRLENAGGDWEGSATGVASFPGRGDETLRAQPFAAALLERAVVLSGAPKQMFYLHGGASRRAAASSSRRLLRLLRRP